MFALKDILAIVALAFITTAVGIVGHDIYTVMRLNRLLALPARALRIHFSPSSQRKPNKRP